MEYVFAIGFVILIVIMVVLYVIIRTSDVKINIKDPSYTKEMLYKEREDLLSKYNASRAKMKEVSGDYFDIAFDEYKAIERELEINRRRIKYMTEPADISCGRVVKK